MDDYEIVALYHKGMNRIFDELERSKEMANKLKDKPEKEEQYQYWTNKRIILDWAYNTLLGYRRSP